MELVAPAQPDWCVIKRTRDGGQDKLDVLYWVHKEDSETWAATPIGIVPTRHEGQRGWYFLRSPEKRYFAPGETQSLDRVALERWIEERREVKA